MATTAQAQMPDPKSPSPPPEPPTALTPGVLATALVKLYTNTLNKTLSDISHSAFSSCFPEISVGAPESIRVFHKDFVDRLREIAVGEFEVILEERRVVENLNRLEGIVGDAKRRKAEGGDDEPPIPPHTQHPPALLKAHLSPHLASQRSLLNAKLQTTESQNAQLMSTIEGQRKEIEQLVKGMETLVGDLEGAAREIGHAGEELGRQGREAEEAMR